MAQKLQTRPGRNPRGDEQVAWKHFCRTGCIVPEYAYIIAREWKVRRERDDLDWDEET